MAVADWTEEELTKQANRLRRDVGTSDAVLDDALAEEYFIEAEEKYPNDTSKMLAQGRVVALRGIRASAALLGKYARNQSMDDLTEVFKNLTIMLNDAIADVEKVADPVDLNSVSPFFFGTAQGERGR